MFNKICNKCLHSQHSIKSISDIKHMTGSQCFECESSNWIRLTSAPSIGKVLEKRRKDDEKDPEDIQTTSNELLRSKKGGGWGRGAVSSRSFDLLNSMIYDLKRSLDDCLITGATFIRSWSFFVFLSYFFIFISYIFMI